MSNGLIVLLTPRPIDGTNIGGVAYEGGGDLSSDGTSKTQSMKISSSKSNKSISASRFSMLTSFTDWHFILLVESRCWFYLE